MAPTAEAQHHVDEYQDQREQKREARVLEQLFADLRADIRGAADRDVRVMPTQRVEHAVLDGRNSLGAQIAAFLTLRRR